MEERNSEILSGKYIKGRSANRRHVLCPGKTSKTSFFCERLSIVISSQGT